MYVLNCYFSGITYDGDFGGAIYVMSASSSNNLLIERSSFISCRIQSASGEGGAIFVGEGNCVLSEVCGDSCSSNYDSSFAGIILTQTSTMNYVMHSSIASCKATSTCTMQHQYGYIRYNAVNISNNEVNQYSAGIYYPSTYVSEGIGVLIGYICLSNNIATSAYCIRLDGLSDTTSKYEIASSNIVGNIGESTICVQGTAVVVDCCIMENSATYVFYTSSDSSDSVTL